MSASTVLLLPGWLDSGVGHWQSLWEIAHGDVRVVQHDYQRPRRGDWMARLDEVILDEVNAASSIILVAHSLGCHLVAAWAEHSSLRHRVSGALLVAPPDVAQADFPVDLINWRTPVLKPLVFASVLVASNNDPFGRLSSQAAYATAWGSQFVEVGALGHINGESGLGDWPQGRALVQGLQRPRRDQSIIGLTQTRPSGVAAPSCDNFA